MIFVGEIQQAVADHYGITLEEMLSSSRCKRVARPRMLAMCLAVKLTDHSTVRIGNFFGRDHSTVVHARDEFEWRLHKIGPTSKAVKRITRQLGYEREMTEEERAEDAREGSAALLDALLHAKLPSGLG